MTAVASAPGKLIALGEYAVLDGAPALVFAVNRRAVAYRRKHREPPTGPFLTEAEKRCAAEIAGAPVDRPTLRVDSSQMREGDRKLGLGSSAAATVAYVAARLHLAGEPFSRARIHAICHAVHGDVSARFGARGSGVDVAASVWGGALEVTPTSGVPNVRSLSFGAVHFVAIDSGQSANTRELVERVALAETNSPGAVGSAKAHIAAASRDGIAALVDESVESLIAAFEAGLDGIRELGRAAGLELVTETHEEIAKTARNRGGAAKSTGAGGGDAALAVFATEAQAGQFCGDLVARGIKPVDLAVESTGVSV